MFVGDVVDDIFFQDIDLIASIQVVPFCQRTVSHNIDAVFLSKFDQGCIGKVRMNLNLKCDWFDFAVGEQIHNGLPVEVGQS